MQTEIIIETNLFPAYPNEELEINPGRFGKRLAEYLIKELEKDNIKVADLYATDYSYELKIEEYKFNIYIMTGNIDGERNKFIISIEPKKKFIRKLFKRIPTAETVNIIYDSILKAVQNNKEIKIIFIEE
jgi:hypothetical protein